MSSQNLDTVKFLGLSDEDDGKRNSLMSALYVLLLLFFTSLFVYFLYLCIRRRRPDIAGGNPNAPPGRAAGLDPASISDLPMFSYGSAGNKKPRPGTECAICLSVFQEGEKVRVLPLCRHGFHSDCVGKWLATRSNCPLCRAPILRLDSELP